MPSLLAVLAGSLVAALFFTVLGWTMARALLPRCLAAGLAPTLGWAAFSALALPVFSLAVFTPVNICAATCLLLAAGMALRRWPCAEIAQSELPIWAFGLAALLAVLPAVAILPKYVPGGVLLAPPVFDHAKVAMIDDMRRLGMPPGNPFLGLAGRHSSLSYYYLWHFTAASLALPMGLSGWEADAAMTWFTAFASALLMMALAVHLSGKAVAALLAAGLSLPASLRILLVDCIGAARAEAILPGRSELGGWLNQASWVPQHLMSGCCVVAACVLLARLAGAGGWRASLVLPLLAAAGFESSAWVGGIAFAASCAGILFFMLFTERAESSRRFVQRATVSAGVSALLSLAFALHQAHAVAALGVGVPIAFESYSAFGAGMRSALRSVVDFFTFWPLLLPFTFPALLPAAILGWPGLRAGASGERRRLLRILAICAIACLATTWLLRSTIENNDLGWRAVIPAVLIMTALASAAWTRWIATRPIRIRLAAPIFLLSLLGLPGSAAMLVTNAMGKPSSDGQGFADSVSLWQAVRHFAGPTDRVGNNPLLLAGLTPWADNIGWALLSNRRSCYSGWATAIAYAALPREELIRTSALFLRVFAGHTAPGDVETLARTYDCQIIVVTASDGAWQQDAFAGSPAYALVDTTPGKWRIYRRSERPE